MFHQRLPACRRAVIGKRLPSKASAGLRDARKDALFQRNSGGNDCGLTVQHRRTADGMCLPAKSTHRSRGGKLAVNRRAFDPRDRVKQGRGDCGKAALAPHTQATGVRRLFFMRGLFFGATLFRVDMTPMKKIVVKGRRRRAQGQKHKRHQLKRDQRHPPPRRRRLNRWLLCILHHATSSSTEPLPRHRAPIPLANRIVRPRHDDSFFPGFSVDRHAETAATRGENEPGGTS